MHELQNEIKALIIDALELEDISVEEINSDEALFADGLGLDSIDALELGLAIKKKYAIKLESNSEESRKHFYSVASLATFIQEQRELG